MKNTLETSKLQVGYSKRIIVEDVNFSLKAGEILCLLGPNGCGKSTIIKSIIDQIKTLDGSIFILGEELEKLSDKKKAKNLSVVLTERPSPDLMTAYDLVATGRYPHTNYFGKLTKKDEKIIEESISMVHGENLANKEISQLSDGERQRIMIARAICQESEIMVLDEPTSYLDIRYKIELLDILRKLAVEKKKTIILSLHEIELVSKIADYVMLIDSGKVFGFGRPEDIINDENIRRVYNISCGSFNSLLGSMELPLGTENKGEVFVIGGNGKGVNVYRTLNKDGINFYSGILFENDLDYEVSKNLALETVWEKAFREISDTSVAIGKCLIDKVDTVIDCGAEYIGINEKNLELLNYAKENHKKILKLNKNGMENTILEIRKVES